jgi:hypothetical protein
LFIFTVGVGTVTVAAISLSPFYARRVRLMRSSRLGTVLVGTAIVLGAASMVPTGGILPAKDELFLCLFAVLLLGTLLILGDDSDERGDDGDGDRDGSDDDPPWWPEFEKGFSHYTRQPRSPVTSR